MLVQVSLISINFVCASVENFCMVLASMSLPVQLLARVRWSFEGGNLFIHSEALLFFCPDFYWRFLLTGELGLFWGQRILLLTSSYGTWPFEARDPSGCFCNIQIFSFAPGAIISFIQFISFESKLLWLLNRRFCMCHKTFIFFIFSLWFILSTFHFCAGTFGKSNRQTLYMILLQRNSYKLLQHLEYHFWSVLQRQRGVLKLLNIAEAFICCRILRPDTMSTATADEAILLSCFYNCRLHLDTQSAGCERSKRSSDHPYITQLMAIHISYIF